MYISAINPLNSYQTINNKVQTQKTQLIAPQSCDIVSFGNFYGKFEEVLYRAIGKSELDELLKPNGRILGHKYTTGNPMGWGARDWDAGFKYGQKDYFFVQFKKNHFDNIHVYNASDYSTDSRYVITKGYSLEDIEAIREGTNAHGKIIWASSEEIIQEDKQAKITSIFRLLKQLLSTKDETIQNRSIVEISSYAKEFPQLIQPLIPLAKADSNFAHKLLFVIGASDNKSYLNFVKSYFKQFIQNYDKMKIHDSSLIFMSHHASNQDLELVLKVMEKDKDIMYHSYGNVLAKILEDKDIPQMLKLVDSSNYSIQNAILRSYICKEDKKTTLKIARNLLSKYSSLDKNTIKEDELKSLLSTITEVMSKYGTKKDIPLMKPFTNLGIYTDIDFRDIIKDLQG